MVVSGRAQVHIQRTIDSASAAERGEMASQARSTLEDVSSIINFRLLTPEENKATTVAIEILTRIEATEQGKGLLFRTKRRFEITQMYTKP